MIAQTRSIAHSTAYAGYAQKKLKNGVMTATFIGADNMVTNTDLIFNNQTFVDELWQEFQEAKLDYVRKGKDVVRDTIVIEFSPTTNESEGWSREQWYEHAKELLEEMDNIQLQTPVYNAKKKRYERDENGNLVMRNIPQTRLAKSKWMAYLHKDSASGIHHLHIIISRFNDRNELNADDDIAKRGAQAAERLNAKHGYRLAEDIRDEHISEIRNLLDEILFDMEDERIDANDLQKRIKEATFIDYKGNIRNYDMQYHADDRGRITGWSVRRGNSTYTGREIGLSLNVNPNVQQKNFIKDAIYDTLRQMDDHIFSWQKFVDLMRYEHGCQVELKRDSNDNVVNYSVSRGKSKPFFASKIGANITAKKILDEWRKEHAKLREKKDAAAKKMEEEKKVRRWSAEWQEQEAKRKEQQKDALKRPTTVARKAEPTEGEKERRSAIAKAKDSLASWLRSPSGILWPDMKDDITSGAAAQAVENGNSPFVNVNLEMAAMELMEELEITATQVSAVVTTVADGLIGMLIPTNMPVSGGGGGSNDLPKQKDDWWDAWKNAFGMKLKGSAPKR